MVFKWQWELRMSFPLAALPSPFAPRYSEMNSFRLGFLYFLSSEVTGCLLAQEKKKRIILEEM